MRPNVPFHSSAVDTQEYLARCLVYIDLNMVRAGVVRHPRDWEEAGYHELQQARPKYRIIDRAVVAELLAVPADRLARLRAEWIETALASGHHRRDVRPSMPLQCGTNCRAERCG